MAELIRRADIDLRCGDCTKIISTLSYAKCVVTDPPYGVGINYGATFKDDLEAVVTLVKKMIEVSIPKVDVIALCAGRWTTELHLYKVMPPKWRMCWYKGAQSMPSAIGFCDWEAILIYGNKVHCHAHDYFQASPERMGNFGHPCPKPIKWAYELVRKFSKTGDTVIDPFMGSGTTGVACKMLGRRFIGIDINPDYVEIARRRINAAEVIKE